MNYHNNHRHSPLRLLIIITMAVFIMEMAVMGIMGLIPALPGWERNVLNSLLLVISLTPVLYLSVFRPLTLSIAELQRNEKNMRIAAKVFENNHEAVTITDANNRIVMVNQAFTTITGYSQQEVIGKNPSVLASGRQSADFYQEMWNCLAEQGYWHGELWNRRKSGEEYPEWLTISVIKDETGNITNYIGHFSDIMERKRAENRIYFLSHYDELTQLPNRTLLKNHIDHIIANDRRGQKKFAILLLDLDHFKNINDPLGHRVGDNLLQALSQRLTHSLRNDDVVARLGGDEFAIILPNVDSHSDIAIIAQKIIHIISKPFSIDGHNLAITPSIGIGVYPRDGNDFDTLIKNADAAMYYAKQTGRNNYQFFTQKMNNSATERLTLENSLRQALDHGELSLHYQPLVETVTGDIVGAEALLRWQHPELGWISPVKFIPIAEESGLIGAIGEWVLETACAQNRRWQQAGLPEISVAVNISAVQFHRQQFCKTIYTALKKSGLDPDFLCLELTESTVIHDLDNSIAMLSELRKLGCQLAIDDFGTGYSSLSYLKKFPIHKLKVDRAFVRDIATDSEDAAIVAAILALAKTLKLEVVAEGVETEAQFNYLLQHGCDQIQGFYFSKPLPVEEFTALLQKNLALANLQQPLIRAHPY